MLYVDVMADSYPLPLQQRDSNHYSDSSAHSDPINHSFGIAQALGVRVPIYERVHDIIQTAEAAERNPGPDTMDDTSNTAANSD